MSTTTGTTDRKMRCRMNDRRRNPCPNEELTEYGVCMRHLRETADEWAAVLAAVREPLAAREGHLSVTPPAGRAA